MIKIKINRGNHLILEITILILFVLIVFNGCAAGPISKEDMELIQSVSISISDKIAQSDWYNKEVNFEHLNEDVINMFGLVQTFKRPPRNNLRAVAYGDKNNPVLYVFYRTDPPMQVLRYRGPYADDPSIKEYWDKNVLLDGIRFSEMLNYIIKKNNIDIPEIVLEEFTRELKKSGMFPLIVPEGGDAQIELTITGFYINSAMLYTGDMLGHHDRKVVTHELGVNAKISKPDGTVIWKGREGTGFSDLNDQRAIRIKEEYLNNPDLFKQDIETSAQFISTGIINSMLGEK